MTEREKRVIRYFLEVIADPVDSAIRDEVYLGQEFTASEERWDIEIGHLRRLVQ